MKRILAIDYGGKRVGIAVTDPMQMIASALTTVSTTDALTYLQDYCKREPVSEIVVGQPKRWSGELSEIESSILKFIESIEKVLPEVTIVRYDERFTSKMAFRSQIENGVKKKDRRDKSRLDSISAALILQDYMASKL